MLKRNLMIASGAAMALTLSACGGNDAEDTAGADMMAEDAAMDGSMTEDDEAMMGADGMMSGEAGADGSMSSGAAGAGAGSGSMSSGAAGTGATGTNVPGGEAPDDVIGDQPSGGANVPTPE